MKLHLFLLLLLTACVTEDMTDIHAENVVVGDPLPEFSVVLNDGSTVTTSSLKGKTSMIVFFNTMCGDCRAELPVIQQVRDRESTSISEQPTINLVCIARAESEESIAAFWHEAGLTLPYSPQPDAAVYNLFATSVIPRIYIANSEGIITAIFTDSPIPTLETLLNAITAQ